MFILLLAREADSKILIQKSVRVFIELMWQLYQIEIVKWIFLPFCAYMCIIMYIGAFHLGTFLDTLEDHNNHEEIIFQVILVWIFSVICAAFIAFFIIIEYQQIKQNPREYFMDYWNYIDGLGLLMNGLLMVMLNINCMNESNDVFPKDNVRLIGALGSFLLWVKLFYWMRLFKETAYFITLIT